MVGLVKNAKEYQTFKEQTEKGGVISFEEHLNIRIKKDDRKQIRRILKKDDSDLYDSEGHFVRCAIRKLIREERQRLKL
jgi:hypothetical protein